MNKAIQQSDKQTQLDTSTSEWTPKPDHLLWRDISIDNAELVISKVSELCGRIQGARGAEAWRSWYYDQPPEFGDWWKLSYYNHFKKTLGAKVYSRLDHLVGSTRDIEAVIAAGMFVEGKNNQPQAPQVNVQINNDKNKYDI